MTHTLEHRLEGADESLKSDLRREIGGLSDEDRTTVVNRLQGVSGFEDFGRPPVEGPREGPGGGPPLPPSKPSFLWEAGRTFIQEELPAAARFFGQAPEFLGGLARDIGETAKFVFGEPVPEDPTERRQFLEERNRILRELIVPSEPIGPEMGALIALSSQPGIGIPALGIARLRAAAQATRAARGAAPAARRLAVEQAGAARIPKGGVPKVVPPPEPVIAPQRMADLQPMAEVVRVANEPDNARKLANLPGVRNVVGVFNPSGVANTPAQQAVVGRMILRAEGSTKAQGAMSFLDEVGRESKIFGPLDEKGLLTQGTLKGKHLNDIRTFPGRHKLTSEQRRWIDVADGLERDKLALLERNGIELSRLEFADGGQFAGRRVVGKVSAEGDLIEAGFIGAGPGRPGVKLGFEKTRIFETAKEAADEGFRFLPESETLRLNVQGAYNKVADKQMTEWLLDNVPFRTTEGPADLKAAVGLIRASINRDRQALRHAETNLRRTGRDIKGTATSVHKGIADMEDVELAIESRDALRRTTAFLRGKLVGTRKRANSLAKEFSRKANKDEAAFSQVERVRDRLDRRIAKLDEVMPEWQEALRQSQTTRIGEVHGLSIAPAFAGKIFTGPQARETVEVLRRSFNPEFNRALGAVNQLNAVGRFMVLSGDFSPMSIQLQFLLGLDPKIWAQAGKGFVRAMFNPRAHARFMAKHNDTIQKSRNLILTSGGRTEFTEAMAAGGLLRKGPLRPIGKLLEPFQRGAEGSFDTAGIYLRESLDHLATTPERAAQVEAFINEIRGLSNTGRLGVGSQARQIETMALLAPRYFRSIVSLLFDVTQGNLRGELARKALIKGTAAITAIAMGISYARGESGEEMVRHLDPNSPKFMTWEVGGQNIGPGGKVRSIIKLIAATANDPETLLEKTMENPGLRFMRGNLAPVPSTALDILTGRDFLGEPTRDGVFSLTKRIARNFMPIFIQSMVMEGGSVIDRLTRGAAEEAGLRAFETPPIQKFVTYAESKLNKPYDEITGTEKKQLQIQDPTGKTLWDAYQQDLQNRGRGKEVFDLIRDFGDEREQGLIEDAAKLRGGLITHQQLKQSVIARGAKMGNEIGALEKNPRYADDLRKLREEPQDIPENEAYRRYQLIINDPVLDLGAEGRDYQALDARLNELRQEIGEELWSDILRREQIVRSRLPAEVQRVYEAFELLRPYWDLADATWAQYPPEARATWEQIRIEARGQTDISIQRSERIKIADSDFTMPITMARLNISLARRDLKDRNPRIKEALRLYYGR